MSSGKRQHDRPLAPRGRDLEGVRDVLGNAVRAVDLRGPLAHLAEHAAIVDLLEGLALDHVGADLADEQDDRRRVLVRRVHADRGVGRAGAARHERHARLAGELGVGVGHEGRAGFVAIDDQADAARVMQRVEHGKIALAGDAEREVDALDHQLIDEDAGAGAGHGSCLPGRCASVVRARCPEGDRDGHNRGAAPRACAR